ncbi:hypothetical protein J4429_03970 [Candidatus Pacearchaeota archaeon]|nr:hypothetical protein [Candidatus Pacearchaeota archaeon]
MYNIDFLPQLEESRRHLFGNSDPHNPLSSALYHPPLTLKIIKCGEDINGEWVPVRALEGKAGNK